MENEIRTLANDAISILNDRVTDEIFLVIQSNRVLMQRYLSLVERGGAAHANREIGKIVKERYGLTNASRRETEPKSTLIQSHQTFE